MQKLKQMDIKLKYKENDRQELRKKLQHNKHENLENYFTLARATEEKLQQMAEGVETTDKEREKYIKKDMEEMKRRNKTVNEKLWNLEKRIDTMRRYQAESACAIQSKLDALLRNSVTQGKTVSEKLEKQRGTRVDFVEPQSKKQESTLLTQIHNSLGSRMTKKNASGAHTSITPDDMTWANT